MAACGLRRFLEICLRMRDERLESGYIRALGLMAFAALGGSLAPLAFYYGGAIESPLIVSGVYWLGAAVGLLALASTAFWRLSLDWSVTKIVMSRACAWTLGLAGLSYFDFAFYALSLRFIDISVAAILTCLGPVLMMLLLARISRGRRRLSASTGGLAAVCCVGAALVAFSERGFVEEAIDGKMVIGCGLALVSSAAMIATGFIFPWSVGCADALLRDKRLSADRILVDIYCLCVALILVSFASGAISAGIGIVVGEPLDAGELGIVAIAGLVLGWAALSWRVANLFAGGVAINALMYLEPAIAMGWILTLGITAVARVDLLVIGSGLIVGANMAIALWARQ